VHKEGHLEDQQPNDKHLSDWKAQSRDQKEDLKRAEAEHSHRAWEESTLAWNKKNHYIPGGTKWPSTYKRCHSEISLD